MNVAATSLQPPSLWEDICSSRRCGFQPPLAGAIAAECLLGPRLRNKESHQGRSLADRWDLIRKQKRKTKKTKN